MILPFKSVPDKASPETNLRQKPLYKYLKRGFTAIHMTYEIVLEDLKALQQIRRSDATVWLIYLFYQAFAHAGQYLYSFHHRK